jgi:RHS repeat-associated protein
MNQLDSHRSSLRIRSIAAVLIPVMAFGPERVLALHNEATAHRAMSEAVMAAAVAQAGGDVTWTFDYDNNGNLIRRADGARADEYRYDGENRLIGRDSDDDLDPNTPVVEQVSYTYDVDGIRTGMTDAGGVTTYLTDKNRDYAQVLVETENPGASQSLTRYYYGDDLISQDRGGGVSYFHYDGQLSTRQLTDNPSGTAADITDTFTYEAFGGVSDSTSDTAQQPSDATNYLYTGEQYDPNVGFYYLRARYYDQANGRFTTRDPASGTPFEPLTLHKYSYAGADPINKVDPSGLFFTLVGQLLQTAFQGIIRSIRAVQLSVIHAIVGVQTAAISLAYRLMALILSGGVAAASRFQRLVQQAAETYPALIRLGIHSHHVVPQYIVRHLRNVGVWVPNWLANFRIPRPAPYHQFITNAIAAEYPFGAERVFTNHGPNLFTLLRVLLRVYREFPVR